MRKRIATAIISTSLLLFLFVACVDPADSKTDEAEKEVKNDKYVKLDMQQAAKELDLFGIPDDLQYMWTNDSFGLEMPEKNQIKRIALYWYQPAYEFDTWSSIYECIDFSDNKIFYRSAQIPGMETIEYDLLEADKIRYLEAIDYKLFTEGVKANNKWNVSIEYENGECYLYNLSYEWTDKEDPKRNMLKTLFDSVEMNELDHFYAAF